jgi:hypothetical protein
VSRPAALAVLTLVAQAGATRAWAAPPRPVAALAALVPADDARKAVAIGPGGEVYEPDGKGAWIHRLPSGTADLVTAVGRAGPAILAAGNGAIYRLAGNGWSAIRVVQHGKAILGTGRRALAGIGRQLFALDPLVRGEPTKLATAPAAILAIGAGARAIVVATEAGVYRIDRPGAPLIALPGVPKRLRLVSDRWALVDRGALDLGTKQITPWPTGLAIGVTGIAPDDALVAIGASHGGLELVTLRAGALTRDPLGVTGAAVGVVVDRAGRAAVALADGRIAMRSPGGWTVAEVTAAPAAEHPGAPPAISN